MSCPFGDASRAYLSAGWWPLPVLGDDKARVPAGFTGYRGRPVTAAEVERWAEEHGGRNIALRLPADLVALDVDHYGAKRGGDTLAEREAELGALPPTVVATARDLPSGRRLYRVPAGTRLRTSAGSGIDVLQHHHRYVVVAPSVHHSGALVRWVDEQSGEELDRLPEPDDVPDLPWRWLEALSVTGSAQVADPADDTALAAWCDECADALRPGWLEVVVRGARERITAGEARHDSVLAACCQAAREATAGAYSASAAVDALRGLWAEVMDDPRRAGEADDLLRWAVGQLATDDSRERVAAIRAKLGDTDGAAPRKPRGKPGPESVATQLVRLAAEHYRFAQDDTGRAFAVPIDGPAIAVPLEGGRGALRDELARRYFDEHGKAASKSALADAVAVLSGMAASAPAERLALRAAMLRDDLVVIDLGRPDGRAVVVTPDGWEVVDRPPVLLRRTELTGPLPDPVPGEGAAALRRLVNVPAEAVPVLLGWCVASFLTDVPRPILAVFAEQGAGKTSTVRAVVHFVDPSPVPLRAAPTNLEGWVVAAAGSSVVALDNLSTIPPWLSDALCRAATGEGLVRRRLYTDDGLAVTTMRRAVVLTTIDAGALRGDLAERLLALELEPIDARARRTDAELAADLEREHPAVFAAILDALAGVLAHLPKLPDDLELPRMADFGRVLAALDSWAGTDALATYRAGLDRVAVDVVEGDAVAAALRAVALGGGFDGTATELADVLRSHRPAPDAPWPTTPRAVAGVVRRCAPALRATGVEVTTTRTGTARRIVLAPASDANDGCDDGSSVAPQGCKGEERGERHGPRGSASSSSSLASLGALDGMCERCRTEPAGLFSRYCLGCSEEREVAAS